MSIYSFGYSQERVDVGSADGSAPIGTCDIGKRPAREFITVMAYIPSDLSARFLMTNSLSSSFHLDMCLVTNLVT